MADLRWILLLAGLLFLAGLTAWELRRPRQARRDALEPTGRSEPQLGQMHEFDAESQRLWVTAAPSHAEVPPFGNPLVISLDDPVEPPTIHPVHLEPLHEERVDAVERSDAGSELPEMYADASPSAEAPLLEPTEEQPTGGVLPGEILMPVLLAAEPVDPIVEWPPEEQRHILSIRVVGLNPERLSGRPLRQALAACGFVHGRFGIFHQPGADGRALVSAANLSKPGVFDPNSMDFQRFRGLGLFAVLPGPLPPAAALDHLLDTASDLADRLQARLQDEHGQPLDEARLEAMARTVHDISNGALRSEPAA
jgi:FtsZ-interacting cell division protein ZipA